MSDLPPYSPASVEPAAPKSSLAGSIQTCGIADLQHDYFRITQLQDSPNKHQVSLTVDDTPLYLVEISQDPSAVADVQLFTAFRADAPHAACRMAAKKGSKEVAMTCTSDPLHEGATWRPLLRAKSTVYRTDFTGSLPLVMVPGCRPVWRNFSWRFGTPPHAAVELWLRDEVPYSPYQSLDRAQLFANYHDARSTGLYEKGVLEMRRGGGLQFEYGVLVSILSVLELARREKEKR